MKTPSILSSMFLFVCLMWHNQSYGDKPNILLILSDDHSYPFVSCYGDSNVRTPTLDRLAKDGMRFHRFFTACPHCVPSRAAYMTGRSAVAARMTRFSSPLPTDEVTLPEILKSEAGYFTGICGRSFHLDGSTGKGAQPATDLLTKNNMRTFQSRVDFLEGSPDIGVSQKFATFLDIKPADKPFFMWANFSDPHHVWNAPAELRPDPKSLKLPAHWPDLPGMREQLADYCAEVNRLDQSVASVIHVLEERKLLDSTLIVFAGDNGAALPHGKGSLYDPGSNVPLIVRWPGIQTKGGESRTLLSNEDIAPTLLESAGLKPGPKMSGKSFWPLLVGKAYEARKHIFVERGPHGSAPVTVGMTSSGFDLSRAVRSEKFKFIYNCTPWIPYSPVDSAGGAAWSQIKEASNAGQLPAGVQATYFQTPRPVYELYDLEKDPSELNNVAGRPEHAEVEDELRLALCEKMIVDFDYLPLPEMLSETTRNQKVAKEQNKAARTVASAQRVAQFEKLDVNKDGKLTPQEFRGNRTEEEATNWFVRRDINKDGVVDRSEFLPEKPLDSPK